MTSDKRKRRVQGACALMVLVVAGVVVFSYRSPADSSPHAQRWLTVNADPLVHQIGLVGKIEPEKTITLTAPFDGNVQDKLVEQGQRVEAGQPLLRMDPALLEVQLRDALSTQLKARRTVREMQDWLNGPQVARARRTLRTTEMSLRNVERRLAESRTLYSRGIIPRNELDELEQQSRSQHIDLGAAQIELQQAIDQGQGEYRQIAEMELANATVKYDALHKLLDGKDLLAPFSGIVVPAPGANQAGAGSAPTAPIQAGSKVSQGQVLFGLSSIEQLKIVARVSELDINQLHQGQTVEVLGDGFDGERLNGSVEIVSSLALPGDTPGGSAQFPVTLSIPRLSAEQMKRVRLGMSARLTIVTYRNDQAIVVPAEAIQRTDKGLQIEYRATAQQPSQRITVTTGQSTAAGVEVFGLGPGLVRIAD